MYVTPDEKLCFIAHPRTASRATAKALGLRTFESTGHHEFDYLKCAQIAGSGGITACTIRNPFDVVVSWYFNEHFREDGRHKKGEFKPWAMKSQLRHNSWLNCKISSKQWNDNSLYFYGLPVVNHILRFENLEEDLRKLCWITGHTYVPTKPYGVLPRDRDYRVYYDSETIALVEERFAQDLELTGYTF
jgi:hypothetical protein